MNTCKPSAGGGAVYGLGMLGALVYYLQHASSLSTVLMGLVKAILWPAFFVYQALTMVNI